MGLDMCAGRKERRTSRKYVSRELKEGEAEDV